MKKTIKYLVAKIGKGRLTFIALFAIFLLGFILLHRSNEYMKYRLVPVIVKSHVVGRYNSLNLIVHNSEWGVFDITVSPSTYHNLKDGDKASFKLREMDIRQTARKNLIYFFGEAFLFCFALVFFLMIFLVNLITKLANGLSSGGVDPLKMPFLGFWTS